MAEEVLAVVELDVGGMLYKVSRQVLERYKDSKLWKIVSSHFQTGVFDSNGPVFIDRNGRLFEYVLEHVRTDALRLPPSVSNIAVNKELRYYGVAPYQIIQYDTRFDELAEQILYELLAVTDLGNEMVHELRFNR